MLGKYGIDFKRDPIASIRDQIVRHNEEAIDAARSGAAVDVDNMA